jgi:dihydropyrimidinase
MFDLVVSGGKHVLPGGVESVDLSVAGGKIVAIGAPGSLAALGPVRVVDATGQIVIPGGIDPHIHCGMAMQMPNQPAPTVSGPPEQVSRAALFGGTTTMIDFVPVAEEQTLQVAIEARGCEWKDACYCDYGLHLMLFDHIGPPSWVKYRRRCKRALPASRCSPPTSPRSAWPIWCRSAISGR